MLKSKSQKELVQLSKAIVQPLFPNFHKGQAGKVAVIGGCEDYTGAPFFAGHSAALLGADLSHIICEKLASGTIKLYSPDLMVHPYLYELLNPEMKEYLTTEEIGKLKKLTAEEVLEKSSKLDSIIENTILPKVLGLLNRIDITVIGPGFGRDPLMLKTLVRIIEEIKVLNKPMILDADALYLVSIDPQLIKSYPKAIITPNIVEFDRIAKRMGLSSVLKESDASKLIELTLQLSKKLGNISIFHKNRNDLMVHNGQYLINDFSGSRRRVGGQGDTLTGALATFVNWSNNYQHQLWEVPSSERLSHDDLLLLACFAASSVVRLAASKAFAKYGRSLQTSTLHLFLGEAYSELYDSNEKL